MEGAPWGVCWASSWSSSTARPPAEIWCRSTPWVALPHCCSPATSVVPVGWVLLNASWPTSPSPLVLAMPRSVVRMPTAWEPLDRPEHHHQPRHRASVPLPRHERELRRRCFGNQHAEPGADSRTRTGHGRLVRQTGSGRADVWPPPAEQLRSEIKRLTGLVSLNTRNGI